MANRIEIPFIGGAYEGPSLNINAQQCQNLYPITDAVGGKTSLAIRNTPGMLSWLEVGGGEIRGFHTWNGYLYAVIGSELYKIDSFKGYTNVGSLSTSTGRVYIASGTTYICIVDGLKGYYQDSDDTSLTEITDVDFPTPGSLTYQDGFFIVTELGTDSFYISASEDPSSWDALSFASAEDTPDEGYVIVSHNRELWYLGEKTYEVFANTGNTTFPFSRISGAVRKIGLGAKDSMASGTEGLFWLDDKYRPRMAQGYEAMAIAPEQIEHQIQNYTVKSDAVGFTYTQEGHGFYVLTFPSEDITWVFDISTGLWHTRSSGLTGIRWRANCSAWFNSKVLVGDYSNGNIYELDHDTYTDVDIPNKRIRSAQPIHNNRNMVSYSSFEIEFEAGVGLTTGQGSNPQAMLEISDDGGHNFNHFEHWATIGKIGKYKTRAIWRRLGRSRARVFRVTITDPVKVVIIGAFLEGR